MKFSSQEEYGLRCLLRLGAATGPLTIPEIAELEGISEPYVGKILRVLRTGGLVTAARGAVGGYTLARAPEAISAGEALAVLGGRLFEPKFCKDHAGSPAKGRVEKVCTHSVDCSLRSLWRTLQLVLDQVLEQTSLKDLLCNEQAMTDWVGHLVSASSLAARI